MAANQAQAPKRPIVLLIHGTFAGTLGRGRARDGRPARAWWDAGSSVWANLRETLEPDGFALAGDADAFAAEPDSRDVDGGLKSHLQPFVWSGANTERARHEAGQQLLDRMLELEEEGRDYHLVGHSHGGSVIWLALQKAILFRWRRSGEKSERCRLRHLRSWCTVGTGFLHYEGTRVGTWYGKALTIVSLLLCLGFDAWIVKSHVDRWQKENSVVGEVFAKLTASPEEPQPERPQEEPLTPFKQAGQEIQRTTSGLSEAVHLGAQVTTGEWVRVALRVLGLLLLVSAPFLTFYLWLHALRTEARNAYREQRAKNQAMLEFGPRWLGLWSSEDEAISGLRATTRVARSQIIPRLRIPSQEVFESDRLIRFWKPFIRLLLAPAYNRLFGPFADSFVLSRLTKAVQGNNRLGCDLVDVSETPVPLEGFRGAHLPRGVDEELIARANAAIARRSEHVLAQTRAGLSQFAWGSGSLTTVVGDVRSQLTAEDLVHTAYFHSRAVRDLVCLHVKNSQQAAAASSAGSPRSRRAGSGAWRALLSGVRAAGWLSLAGAFVVFTVSEAVAGYPAFMLTAALFLTGLAAATVPLRVSCPGPRRRNVLASTGAGAAVMLLGAGFSLLHPLLTVASGAGPPLNRPLVAAILLLGAATCFVLSLTNAWRAPLGASLTGWSGMVLLLLLVALSDWLFARQFFSASGVLLVLLAAVFGLFRAFSPLKQARDVFCLPFPVRQEESASATLPEETGGGVDWRDRFRSTVRERLAWERVGAQGLTEWLEQFRSRLRDRLASEGEVASYALPHLGEPNRVAVVVLALLLGGLIGGLGAPLLLFLPGFQPSQALVGGIAVSSWLAVLMSILLALDSAIRASRGARRGWMARLSLEFFSLVFLTGVAVLLCLSVHEQFFAIPEAETRENTAWLGSASPVLVSVDRQDITSLDTASGQQGTLVDREGRTDWDFVVPGRRGPEEPQLAAVRGNTFSVWGAVDRSEWRIRDFTGHRGPIAALAYSEPEDVWVSASTDREVIVWDARRGRETGRLPRLRTSVRSLAVHPAKPHVALALEDRSLALWDWQTGQQVGSARNLPGTLRDLVCLADGGVVALDDRGVLLRFRSMDKERKLRRAALPVWCPSNAGLLSAPESLSVVESFAVLSQGSQPVLAAGYSDPGERHGLVLGELGGSAPLYRFEKLSAKVTSLAFAPDGTRLAAKIGDSRPVTIWVLDVPSGRTHGVWEHLFQLSAVAFSPDGRTLASGSWGKIGLWEAATGNFQGALSGHQGTVSGVAFSPDGLTLASSSYDDSVRLWDLATRRQTALLRGHADWVAGVAFSPDGQSLASASYDKTARLWDVRTGSLKAVLHGHRDRVTGVTFHPAGQVLATASRDGTVKLWDIASGKETASLSGHDGPVTALSFSPDGSILASGSHDDTVRLWDPATHRERATLRGHWDRVTSLAFRPDGRMLASASHDGAVKLWEIGGSGHGATAKTTLRGYAPAARSLAFAPDGNTLASAGEDGALKLWDIARNRPSRSCSPWILRSGSSTVLPAAAAGQ